ncbi:MAG: YbaB/EbfC family nucleoid-associated protein [Phycisphaerae bacterium]|nr:YbaB/EbfC family nucleoid-associated protein [Phycisphaerae bacterium]
MLGNLGQLMHIMKNAGAIKQGMEELGARLEAARFTGEAGGGQVQCTVNGKGDLIAVKIDPALIQAGDVELVEDLTCAAVRDAINRSREAAQQEMQQLAGGL